MIDIYCIMIAYSVLILVIRVSCVTVFDPSLPLGIDDVRLFAMRMPGLLARRHAIRNLVPCSLLSLHLLRKDIYSTYTTVLYCIVLRTLHSKLSWKALLRPVHGRKKCCMRYLEITKVALRRSGSSEVGGSLFWCMRSLEITKALLYSLLLLSSEVCIIGYVVCPTGLHEGLW